MSEPAAALPHRADTVVVGAGLGGLLAAVTAARARPSASVVVLDAQQPGGRARCDQRDGFTFNRGPRALYVGSTADRALRAVGVDTGHGGKPAMAGAVAIHGGRVHRFPGGPLDSARTTLLSPREKLAAGAALAAVWRADEATTAGRTVGAWLDERHETGTVRQLVEALVRVATYTDAPDVLAAGPALHNARLGVRPGVRYLDGGWQALVDQLVARAGRHGVTFVRAGARSVRSEGGETVIVLADGSEVRAGATVIAAGGPDAAAGLLGATPPSWPVLGPPVTAACLELGLRRAPVHRFALGIDEPVYASTHCPPARLAPEGGAVVHLMRYQRPGEHVPAAEQQARLAALARTIGIAEADVVTERFLARMVVSGAMPTAAAGGVAGRVPVAVADHPGVLLAGDWVGSHGLLLDAVAASATEAARLAVGRSATMVPA
ncbi:NAD(P)-binding protein [Aquihabitans sp. McL0605]|uniref:NAD(P)-binding protein n=1 Tax=Aquihabitans sp. McL0605 TaxID=3415671 RepID=UPI003CF8550C